MAFEVENRYLMLRKLGVDFKAYALSHYCQTITCQKGFRFQDHHNKLLREI